MACLQCTRDSSFAWTKPILVVWQGANLSDMRGHEGTCADQFLESEQPAKLTMAPAQSAQLSVLHNLVLIEGKRDSRHVSHDVQTCMRTRPTNVPCVPDII